MRGDRDKKKNGGGVAVYIVQHFNYDRLDEALVTSSDADFEAIWF